MVLGGVPIGVAIPPMFAPIGMARARAVRSLLPSGIARNTGARKASIIAAVAVLLTNAEKMAVTRMNPRRIVAGFVPNGASSFLASTTSSLVFVIPMASTKPPMNRRIVGSAKQCIRLL